MSALFAVLAASPGDSTASNVEFLPRLHKGINGSPLSVSRPSLIVRTSSNIKREKMHIPNPPCVLCNGSGRIDCHKCHGRGRTNCTNLAMLPKGEWPKWCKGCGGSGLGYCNRCLGTGELRDIMGFHFMTRNKGAS